MSHIITSVTELEALYGEVNRGSLLKETDRVVPEYRAFIEAAPFVALATRGPEGLDCSPRGDGPGFVRVQDDKTLLLPDRRGNNRIDSLKNIVREPAIALLFLIPGIGETLRVNGRAAISIEPALLDSFAVDGRAPKSVIAITVEAVYFQCARAILRSELWNPAKHVARASLPSAGQILAALTANEMGGETYDKALPERQRSTLY
ncbi:pyridoxamine 5'-phosphate oxidase family protein [Microvirga terrae]|uniref:Pyridoxamine 5'-phosphate oxidase family protein n=1 Tax=Microvirga terrae TaxID=2740529 RepID=A0ABY5RR98_9HYPH|nr:MULTISPECIES: pyridoxamine 5'-phosphate oxidase family protein [Microvirga]MBQ0823617.1 pyridoxamine 5'-phosphate oxidase family protein [Microvirga sp. HBU67558]UVF19765.1 pyridoxamine 5'-phosphate oxidase family protein [Microvirga terrae]